ncbi:fatty acid elongation protein, GNS1/SUR4 family, putative [Plasmodium vinckei brucechwatti]|uniref:Fatty acid elongation protein, GNS1/SUR4 family, putative n=1 Tax=Plasmodium vinckei brucechwatti TaxID=119398 RepID=A0A6V7RU64_PLAVN|nr:fatty acid elongation protein, GNS1/SUR4 family, putative [Plasmodium vinckei brucechwatti]
MGTNVIIKTNENGIFQIIENIRNYPQTPVFTVEDKFPILNYFTFSWLANNYSFHNLRKEKGKTVYPFRVY